MQTSVKGATGAPSSVPVHARRTLRKGSAEGATLGEDSLVPSVYLLLKKFSGDFKTNLEISERPSFSFASTLMKGLMIVEPI